MAMLQETEQRSETQPARQRRPPPHALEAHVARRETLRDPKTRVTRLLEDANSTTSIQRSEWHKSQAANPLNAMRHGKSIPTNWKNYFGAGGAKCGSICGSANRES